MLSLIVEIGERVSLNCKKNTTSSKCHSNAQKHQQNYQQENGHKTVVTKECSQKSAHKRVSTKECPQTVSTKNIHKRITTIIPMKEYSQNIYTYTNRCTDKTSLKIMPTKEYIQRNIHKNNAYKRILTK